MTELRRTASSGFDISQAVKLSEIEANPEKADELIQPIDAFSPIMKLLIYQMINGRKYKMVLGLS